MLKIAATLTAIGLSLCLVTAADAAKPPGGGHPGGGGGHPPGGGGGGHPGGGAPHFAPPHFAAPHFSGGHPGGAPHFAGRRPGGGAHVSLGHARGGGPRVAHFDRPSFHAGVSRGRGPTPRISHLATPRVGHPAAGGGRLAGGSHARLAADPKAFAARRHFAANAAFRPFLSGGWHPYHHLGWVGPWFWPYAYGDVFYYALWPADYWDYDPFWVYGYGDIYAGIFSPYSYDEYVQGPGVPSRMAALPPQTPQNRHDEDP
jgi:hypothetical protein